MEARRGGGGARPGSSSGMVCGLPDRRSGVEIVATIRNDSRPREKKNETTRRTEEDRISTEIAPSNS